MMKVRIAIISATAALASALAGCTSTSADAQQELRMVENAKGTGPELCAAKRKLAAAFLVEKKAHEYEVARLSAYAECALAQS